MAYPRGCTLSLTLAIAAWNAANALGASWLDEPKPVSWNEPGLAIPAAPRRSGAVDARCGDLARPPELEQDRRLKEQGWDLIGAYEGGWQILVIRATADYDGMCRPRHYQGFVFVHGVFAGTLSPQPMDSRTDGALDRTYIPGDGRITAEYLRYAATDPLCCASRRARVTFDISGGSVAKPVSVAIYKP